ncbi:MAG: LPS biosynthesis protein WbpP [Candidatus Marinimicrobia bacterium]|nr:LPS biosynthesis protein WbpP [Candidatus Neomarinimicrobiota bacterium]|tara:strand:+ start:14402 stop:15313 length:912 start_codon:yes stop_codon:yes gene_type:complete
MKYVVTGGAGFIGSHLVDALVDQKHEVHVIDNFSTGKKENCNTNAIYHNYDISDTAKNKNFIKIMEGADSIFHCAALARVQPSINNPVKYEMNNTIGTMNMLKGASDAKVRRFIYSASSAVYGSTTILPSFEHHLPNPSSPYGSQKYYGEICCKMFSKVYNLETVSLRYFNVYGERQDLGGAYATVIGIFIKQCLNDTPMTINGDGSQRRDFTYVGDVVKANILSAQSDKVGDGESINIGSGKNISIKNLANFIGNDIIYRDPVNEPFANLADVTKAKKLLDWEPIVELTDWIVDYKSKIGLN